MGVPPPQSQLFVRLFLTPKIPKSRFLSRKSAPARNARHLARGFLSPNGSRTGPRTPTDPKSHKLAFPHLWGPKWVKKKLRLRGWDPPSEIRAAILRLLVVSRSQMVARRPIWWQKGWFWGPLGFRAALAPPWAGGWGGGGPTRTINPPCGSEA